ncbi:MULTISPECIES: hypothetical protein [unclassified Dehalobacter]|uniref:hypothetical protein n=1 Tax=unclassified Dehalobacter TaxID=2635733 RepID=UPI00104C7309|nr:MULTISPECIES: hypothetical protein [unclassified Dehalobacter]TCX50642.1 hypothetical protein C1I36_08820 [Dehalobacter sp. 14DCB1]TCX51222.1 hypothetical protein C1I38_10590 [Dehalobacter sp. 12DCB1]
MNKPSLKEIIEKLQQVVEGKISREDVSNWAEKASQYFEGESSLSQDDISIWKALDVLLGIDLKDSPEDYLHNETDIRNWISRFNTMIKSSK